jgi:hypothetical protein
MSFHILKKKLIAARVANFLIMRSSLLESVNVTEFQATEAYYSSDLTKAEHSNSRLSMGQKGNICVLYVLTLIISLHMKKEKTRDDGNKIKINLYTQILNTVSLQYKIFSKSLFIV